MAFKFGRKPPSNKPAILFKSILAAVPVHPISEDYLASLSNWQVLGNDTYGDCVAVAWANSRRFFTAELTIENYPTQQQVFDVYRTQNPNFPQEDNGMDVQTLLAYLLQNGGPDGVKPIAFAKVDPNNMDEVDAALAIFGGLILGTPVQQENLDDFNAGQPWDYHAGGTIAGGHAILAGGYLAKPGNDILFITWGAETGLTDSFWKNMVCSPDGELWAVIWPENLGTKQFIAGIDLNILAADYLALTGSVLPVNVPPPPTPNPGPPSPSPSPTPVPPKPGPGCVAGAYNEVKRRLLRR
jgi:hypothetical protein